MRPEAAFWGGFALNFPRQTPQMIEKIRNLPKFSKIRENPAAFMNPYGLCAGRILEFIGLESESPFPRNVPAVKYHTPRKDIYMYLSNDRLLTCEKSREDPSDRAAEFG